MTTHRGRGVLKQLLLAILLVSLVRAQELKPWPDGTELQLREEVFGLRLRVGRELRGDAAGEKFLREAFARDPQPEVKAYMAWACLFGQGWGMPTLIDPVRGGALALEAAAEGSMVAVDVYGRAVGQGLIEGVPPVQSTKWLQRAATAGVPRSMARLGVCRVAGFGVMRNVEEGLRLARQAAELGIPDGLAEIAAGYEAGTLGGAANLEAALDLYAEAALHASGPAWARLTELAKTNPRAKRLLVRARVREANDAAWMMEGKARGLVRELEQLAGDDPVALVELGEAYLVGYYAPRDYPKAKAYFERAAAQSSDDARYFLAKMQLRGFAGPKEPGPALERIQQLADWGNGRALAYLGYVNYWGTEEVPDGKKNELLAFRYTRQAAQRGDVWSLANLAFCYEHGIGTPENYVLAAKVYWQAFLRGYQPGREKTRRLLNFVKSA